MKENKEKERFSLPYPLREYKRKGNSLKRFEFLSFLILFYFVIIPFLFLICFGFLLLSVYLVLGGLLFPIGLNILFIPSEIPSDVSWYQVAYFLLICIGVGVFLFIASWFGLKGLIYSLKKFLRLSKEE